MSALVDELLALAMPWPAAKALLDTGVPRATVAGLMCGGDLALGMVDLGRGGLFQFGGPDRRLILSVRRGGELVDLVALSSTCEDEWALRRGEADLLGEDALIDATLAGRRELRLWGTPMAWLRAGCAGVCVLDWNAGALAALRGLGARGGPSGDREPITLVCDAGAKPKLQALLAHGGLPLVAEDRASMGRAA